MATCQHCGNPREQCSDPSIGWYPQRTICYATMGRESANARYDKLHEELPYHDGTFQRWAKERSAMFPFHARDGVTIWVSDQNLTPDDDFLDEKSSITPETLALWAD